MVKKFWPHRNRTKPTVPEVVDLTAEKPPELVTRAFGLDEVRITDPDVSLHAKLIAHLFTIGDRSKFEDQLSLWKQRIKDKKNHRVQAAIATSGVLLLGVVSVELDGEGNVNGIEAIHAHSPAHVSDPVEALAFRQALEMRLLSAVGVSVEEVTAPPLLHEIRQIETALH